MLFLSQIKVRRPPCFSRSFYYFSFSVKYFWASTIFFCVYFIQASSKPSLIQMKIGLSKDPDGRLRDLQFTSPAKLTLIGTIRCKSKLHAFHVERTLHDKFKKQRRHGEWFHLSKKHLAEIEELLETTLYNECMKIIEIKEPDDNVQENCRIVYRPRLLKMLAII